MDRLEPNSHPAPPAHGVLRGFAWLLIFQSLGEVLRLALDLPWPGPVIGMMLLVVALRWRVIREPVSFAAHALLPHLSLLFVPVGVGVMMHTQALRDHGAALLVVLLASTWVGLAVTAMVLRMLWAPPAGQEHP